MLFWDRGGIAWRARLFRCVDTYVSEWEILILKSEGDLLYDARACVFFLMQSGTPPTRPTMQTRRSFVFCFFRLAFTNRRGA